MKQVVNIYCSCIAFCSPLAVHLASAFVFNEPRSRSRVWIGWMFRLRSLAHFSTPSKRQPLIRAAAAKRKTQPTWWQMAKSAVNTYGLRTTKKKTRSARPSSYKILWPQQWLAHLSGSRHRNQTRSLTNCDCCSYSFVNKLQGPNVSIFRGKYRPQIACSALLRNWGRRIKTITRNKQRALD